MSIEHQALSHLHLSLLNALAAEGVKATADSGEWTIELPTGGLAGLLGDLSIGFYRTPDVKHAGGESFMGVPILVNHTLKPGEFFIKHTFDALRALRPKPGDEAWYNLQVRDEKGYYNSLQDWRDGKPARSVWNRPCAYRFGDAGAGDTDYSLKLDTNGYVTDWNFGGKQHMFVEYQDKHGRVLGTQLTGKHVRLPLPQGTTAIEVGLVNDKTGMAAESYAREWYHRDQEGTVRVMVDTEHNVPQWVTEFDEQQRVARQPVAADVLHTVHDTKVQVTINNDELRAVIDGVPYQVQATPMARQLLAYLKNAIVDPASAKA